MKTIVTITAALAFGLLGMACQGDKPSVEKPVAGKADGPSLDKICVALDAEPGCEVCELAGWYGDGTCDDFCAEPDPDCGTPEPEPDSPTCDQLMDHAYDRCIPDDDEAVDWTDCFAETLDWGDVTDAAAACCTSGDWLWCEELGEETGPTCEELLDYAYDRCIPDDDEAVDWTDCFDETLAWGNVGDVAAACCSSGDWLWCE